MAVGAGVGAPLALAGGPYFSQGRYEGRGWCKDAAGHDRPYEIVFLAEKGAVTVKTTEKGESTLETTWSEAGDHGYGFFNVKRGGVDAGWGYCTSLNCHVELKPAPSRDAADGMEEQTLVFKGRDSDELLRIRSITEKGARWACEEELHHIGTSTLAPAKK